MADKATIQLHNTLSQATADDEAADDEVYVFPTSFAQQRFWFLDQFEPNSPFYNIPTAVRMHGRLDVGVLERCLDAIVARHEILRTTFAPVNGQPVQLVAPELSLSLPIIDLRYLPEHERQARALILAGDEAAQPFDLGRGPLLRATLIRLADDEHMLLLTMHHIISDGWSMGVLVGEIAATYNAFIRGEPSPLPELPIQYGDFAEWQREQIQGPVLDRQIDYWREQLTGVPVLDLPTDRPRPAVQSSRGGMQSHLLPAHLARGLYELSRQEGATLFMTVLAAFQVLLHRYSAQEVFAVGTPVANRTRSETEPLIGCFINTLVLPADLSGGPSFRELLRRVRAGALGAFANQDVPFEMLVELLQPERDMSHTPLFQVMLILQNAAHAEAQELPGLTISQVETHSGTSTFDLTLIIGESPEGLEATVEYCSDLFDQATIARMLVHFEQLLTAAMADPERPIGELPMLSEAERAQLRDWNAASLPLPAGLCAHELFEAEAARTPDAIAVVCGDEHLSYAELDERANRLAHYLRELGVGPERLVAICLERSPALIVAVLAVWKAGGAYLPLDPSQPAERLAALLDDAQPVALVTEQPLLARFSAAAPPSPLVGEGGRGGEGHIATAPLNPTITTIAIDADWPQIATRPPTRPEAAVASSNLAYLIYTSGSTGLPKGVLIEHRSLVNAYLGWEQAYDLRQVRRHLQMASFTFDVFAGDLVRALCSGGTLVLCPRELLLEPGQLFALLEREQIECAEFVPAVLRTLMQHLEVNGLRLDHIRLLICGSDSWYVGEYRQFRSLCDPQTRLINSFGLTEATIDSTYFEQVALDAPADQIVPIGRPFPNTRLYVLDQHGQPAPIGVPGELYIGGPGLARAYHGRPDLTAERFVTHPVDHTSGERLYRTGDRVRFLADGNVELLGRADDQLKLRGFRIEPGEIEATLSRHPALHSVAVLARPAPAGDQRLVAYVVPAPGLAPDPSELRRFCQEQLPAYMVPSAFVPLETFPLLANGKLDRKALPEPDWAARGEEAAYVAPRTPAETLLATLWTSLLGVARISIADDFFALGGHSLLATQLVSRVRETFKVDLPLRAIFETSTLGELAARIERAREGTTPPPPLVPAPRTGPLPLSFAQQRLWFLDQLEPGSPLYNIPETMRLHGPLDIPALELSVNEVIRRHESLRTTFHTRDGRPEQVIGPELRLNLPLRDLRHLPPDQREAEAGCLAIAEASRPFDLSVGPLLRASLLRLADDEHLVLLTIHHIISDDWSTGVLIGEIMTLYDAFRHGRPSPLPTLPIQYADFAAWQRAWLQGEVLETQLGYWRNRLAGSPPLLELPTDRPRPAVQSYRGAYRTFSLSRRLTYALKSLGQREGATPFMTLLAAFDVLLGRYSGQHDICVGSPIAGRNRPEIENLIGFFVNTLVLRADLSGDPSFRELLRQVRATTLDAYAHQDLPFEMVVDAVHPERNLSHSPLFQVMFVLNNTPSRGEALADLSASSFEAHSGTAKFDLTLFVSENGNEFTGALEYNCDLFDAATIDRMLTHFQQLLEGLTTDPDQPVTTLPLLAAAERHQLLVEWNATAAPFPEQLGAHQLFAAQAARTPDSPAVRLGDQELSYAQLDARANQLAHLLQQLGAGPDTLVALCLDRSPELVAALLGTLKAGAAYLPLDPTYPAERLAFMIEDARPPIVLTTHTLATQTGLAERAAVTGATVVYLDRETAQLSQQPTTAPPCVAGPDNLAYVIYTSGSTGKPKGALITHRGLTNYLTWALGAYPAAAGHGAPVHSSLAFDLTVTSLFTPLLSGGCAELLPDDGDIEVLGAALRAPGGFSLVKITPAHLELLNQQIAPAEAARATRAFIIGGENLSGETIAFWQQHAPATVLVNEYGPTETVVGCCVYQVQPGERFGGVVPIGRPIANTRLYVLDPHSQPVPVGVVGELYIGGAGVARGYLNRPELTAERFLPDPFVDEPGARLYRTGDLVRYRADGNLECLGRTDHQVKIRGFRIELGEIEAVLGQAAAVREVVVVAREDVSGHRRLVAYVVPADPTAAAAELAEELRAYLKARLPEHMVPAVFVPLAALPLTPNGKVDRAGLPAPTAEDIGAGQDYVAPTTPTEATLAAILAQLLGVEQVGIHDDFFALGGDSILSIQLVARANQAGLRLLPRHVFEAPTVAGLAALAGTGPLAHAEQDLVVGPLPLTPIQRWFFELAIPAPHHWNQSLLLATHEPLDQAVLEATVARLCVHHDALRTRFVHGEHGWEAVIVAEVASPVVWVDLAALDVAEQSAAISREASRVQASLDLATGPLLRVAYFDLGSDRPGRLLLVFHHLVIDGVSWRVLLEDLYTIYSQLQAGEQPRLPLKTSSYRQWAQRLVEHAADASLHEELSYWRSLAELPTAPRPVDEPTGHNEEVLSQSVAVTLGTAETDQLLHEVPAAYRTEINEVLLAALARALGDWSGASAVTIDLEGHGREDLFDDIDLTRTVGWFTTITPVVLDLRGATTPGEALLAVKEQLRRVPRRGIGYALLRHLSPDPAVRAELAALSTGEISFNYLGQVDQALPEEGLFAPAAEASGPERDPRSPRTHLIDINGSVAGGQLTLEWSYSAGRYRQATIERVAEAFLAELRGLIAHCLDAESEHFAADDFADFGWGDDEVAGILDAIKRTQGE